MSHKVSRNDVLQVTTGQRYMYIFIALGEHNRFIGMVTCIMEVHCLVTVALGNLESPSKNLATLKTFAIYSYLGIFTCKKPLVMTFVVWLHAVNLHEPVAQ